MTHHQTTPQFYEEIKIELPPNVHDGHHLRFIIYHVAVDPKKKGSIRGQSTSEDVLTEIGTAWLQLKHRDGRLVSDGVDLPVFVTTKEKPLPDRFMSKIPPEGNWVDGGRKVLSVSGTSLKIKFIFYHINQPYIEGINYWRLDLVTLHSTIHVKGKLLHGFLSNPFEARHISGIIGEDICQLIFYLPLVINGLLSLIASDKVIPQPEYRPIKSALGGSGDGLNNNSESLIRTVDMSKSDKFSDMAFGTLVSLVSILNSQHNQRKNLEDFIFTKLDQQEHPNLHDQFLNAIVVLLDQDLMMNVPKKKTQIQLLDELEIFLQILEKLMFQHLHRTNRKMTKRSKRFPLEFLTNLERLVQVVCRHMGLLRSSGVFFSPCLNFFSNIKLTLLI